MLDAFGSGPNRASWPGRSQFRQQFTARLEPVAAAVPDAQSPQTCAISRARPPTLPAAQIGGYSRYSHWSADYALRPTALVWM